MTFLAATPADKPLVIDGLGSTGETSEVWGRLFTGQPEGAVFTDRIEDESPYMRSQLTADRYDERFTVLVQMRFSTPTKLYRTTPHQLKWPSANRLQIPLEPRTIEDPPEELQAADSIVATTLLIYEYDSKTPKAVELPVIGDDGEPITEIVAQ
jgi:hypothetical protein